MSQASGGEEPFVEQAPESTSTPATAGSATQGPSSEGWWSRSSGLMTERAQDVVSTLVAGCLVVLATAILVAAVVDFFSTSPHRGLVRAATDFLAQVLLVLILLEVVHTVVLSLRAHALAAQPFLVVGLVAVIRQILFALGSEEKLSDSTLGLYIGMVAVFVASLVAIEVFGHGRRRLPAEDPLSGHH